MLVMMDLAWQAFFDRKCPRCNRYVIGDAEKFQAPPGSILVWEEKEIRTDICTQKKNEF